MINIAIDGPAGAGKSTIAKKAAKELGFVYVDTGAMYRAIGLFLLRKKVAADAVEEIVRYLPEIAVTIVYENNEQNVLLNGENVSELIRTPEVSQITSSISKIPKVREKLLELQRNLAKTENVIMDGRDIGTVVLPNADLKLFLTASSAVRADRRYKELCERGIACDRDEIERDIILRDEQDMNREIAPLKQAEDAILLDSSYMNIEETKNAIIELVRKIDAK